MNTTCDAQRQNNHQPTHAERAETKHDSPLVASEITAGWRARRSQLRAQRLKASAEPSRLMPRENEPEESDANDGITECSAALSDLLLRWHRWQIGFSPVPTCRADPMFRNAKSGKGWDSTGQVIHDELNGSTMEAIDFHVGELPDRTPEQPYRSAIYTIAKNLHAGGGVWSSARLPTDPLERGIIYMEARNMLTRRLIAAGVM